MATDKYALLDKVTWPSELRDLDQQDLTELSTELRAFLIETISQVGGHFAGSLGTVELSVALHYVYDTPFDRLVWDIGHQCYPHKILTGRKSQLASIRQQHGLSGFLKRDESDYDCFGAGHSSTSISAALGMAVAAKAKGEGRKVAAIIGDGGLTAGLAYEALNNAGNANADLLVILNDNDMSISPNVGAMHNYLARILSGKIYSTIKRRGLKVLDRMPPIAELARRTEEHVKGMVVPGTLFEELGFNYIGPVDGHDVDLLVDTLRNLRGMEGPQLLHLVTSKGKGYSPAEEAPVKYHAVTPFEPALGMQKGDAAKPVTYTDVFGRWICDMAELDTRLIGITPAMREGSGLVEFCQRFPDRYFDVGIAEQHAVTFAAGLACEGFKPVCAIYSTFLQRAYDQLIHDVAIQNLPVLFAIDRAGLVGADGPTHAGAYDYSFLRCIPNLIVMAPADENECRQMLYTGFQLDQPAAVRYPRGTGPGVDQENEMRKLPLGKGEIRRQGENIAILSFGSMLAPSLEAAEKLNATVANMRFVKPLDRDMVEKLASRHDLLVTVEENAIMGGAGSAVNETLNELGLNCRVINLGLPDEYIEHGKPADLLSLCGLDGAGIHRSIIGTLDPNALEKALELTSGQMLSG